MKKIVLALSAAGEAGTGLLLLVSPSLVVSLLFGVEVGGIATVMSRLAGIALVGLGVACWPGDSAFQPVSAASNPPSKRNQAAAIKG